MENAKMDKLYEVMEMMHDKGDTDAEAALRWAIHSIEEQERQQQDAPRHRGR